MLRDAALCALTGGVLVSDAGLAQEAPALPAAGARFDESTVPNLARAYAGRPFVAQRTDDLPDALKNLTREQYATIRSAPGAAIWSDAGLDFAIEPLHRGFVYTDKVALFLVEEGVIRPLPYARDRFETGGVAIPDFGQQDPGYSGFRLRSRFGGGELADFAIFQGVCFFKLIARGQGFGVNARAVMLRPADPKGEEFPRWRAFFLERPASGGAPMVLHALIESESCVTAVKMTLQPGDASVAEVANTMVTRAQLDHLGLGGMQTTFLFGSNDRRGTDDARAAAYSCGGLRIRAGSDEAIWRPVHNPQTLQISSFMDDRPNGFGLTQRARDYATFQDDVQHWEWRPSLWIEPLESSGVDGIWGQGAVTLLEIPSDAEINENIIAYWRPKAVIPAKTEIAFSYRQTWCWHAPKPPPVATVVNTRNGRGAGIGRRVFFVDFAGDILFAGADGAAPELRTVLIPRAGTITRQTLYPYPERKIVRVVFELDLGGERSTELRLALKTGERQITETWLFRYVA